MESITHIFKFETEARVNRAVVQILLGKEHSLYDELSTANWKRVVQMVLETEVPDVLPKLSAFYASLWDTYALLRMSGDSADSRSHCADIRKLHDELRAFASCTWDLRQ